MGFWYFSYFPFQRNILYFSSEVCDIATSPLYVFI